MNHTKKGNITAHVKHCDVDWHLTKPNENNNCKIKFCNITSPTDIAK